MFSPSAVVVVMVMTIVTATTKVPVTSPPPSPYLPSEGFLAPVSEYGDLIFYTNDFGDSKVVGDDVGSIYGGPTLSFLSPTFAFYVELVRGAERFIVKYDMENVKVNTTFNNSNSVGGFALALEDGTNDILYVGLDQGIVLHRIDQEGNKVGKTDFSSDYPNFSIEVFGAPFKNAFYDNKFYLCLMEWSKYIYYGMGSLDTNGVLTFNQNGKGISCYGDTVIDPEENLVVFQGIYDTIHSVGPYNDTYDLLGIAVLDLSLEHKGEFIFTSMVYNGITYTNYPEYNSLQGHISIDTAAQRIYSVLAPYPGTRGDTILVSMSYTGDNIAVIYENPPFYLGVFSVVNSSYGFP